MPDQSLTPDSFMSGVSSAPPGNASGLSPDSFMAGQQNLPRTPQTGVIQQSPVDALTGLPLPQDARQNAEAKAQDFVNKLEMIGAQQMRSSALRQAPDQITGTVRPGYNPGKPFSNPSAPSTQILDGAARIASGADELRNDKTPGATIGVAGVPLPAPAVNDDIAAGASQVTRGAMDAAALPGLPMGLVTAPLATVGGLAAGVTAQQATSRGLKKLGVSDSTADLAGDVAGAAIGGAAAHALPKPTVPLDGQVLPPERTNVDHQVEPPAPAGPRTINLTPDQFMAEHGTEAPPAETKPASNETKGTPNDNTMRTPEPGSETQDQGQQKAGSPEQQPSGQAGQGEQENAAPQAPGEPAEAVARTPKTPPAYGNPVNIKVPGESTVYPARYSVRELDDVEPSHNPHSFEPNPDYEYTNDRDYSNPQNAARVATYSASGNFDPDHVLTPSPTAEQGPTIIDPRGNALGGNNRAMTINRVYASNGPAAASYRAGLAANAAQFGIDPDELQRFKNPILTRELTDQPTGDQAQKAITDFNKVGASRLTPEEQAVTDGKRMSPRTISLINGNMGELGDGATLAQALRGDRGAEIVNSLVSDGVLTRQEANGYVDDRDMLTPAAKDRIAKGLVGRLFDKSAHFAETRPELRNKLERVAPQVIRVEDQPEWNITQPLRDALGLVADARAHKVNLDDAVSTADLNGLAAGKNYSPDVLAIAKTLERGPVNAAKAFRQYANDAEMSRDGAQTAFFEPSTQREAFDAAFRQQQLSSGVQASLETRPPALSGTPEPFVTGAPSSFHSVRGRIERIPLSADNDALAHAYVANPSAMELVSRALAYSRDMGARLGGLHVQPNALPTLANNLQNLPMRAGTLALIRATREAQAEGKSLVFVHHAAGLNDAFRLEGLNEELNHARQRLISGGDTSRHLGASAVPLLNTPEGVAAVHELTKIGYSFRKPGNVVSEVGVRLMAPDRHHELGLTLNQARTLAANYVRSLRKEYGTTAPRDIARHVFDALSRTDRAGVQQSGSVPASPGQQGRGGPPGPARSDLSGEPAAGGFPDRTGSVGDPVAGSRPNPDEVDKLRTPGELIPDARGNAGRGKRVVPQDQGTLFNRKSPQLHGPSMFDASDTGERSLFDPEDAKGVVDSAAADKAQLDRQRMEAQLKSPLTKDSQKQRLKRTAEEPAKDLFGSELPDQGALFSLPKRAGDDPAKVNYSGLGAIESKTVRNLGQLRRASEPGFNAAVRAASSRSQASVVMKTAMPKLISALNGIPKEDFFRALIQSRLSGIQQRWQDMAEFATRASDENLTRSMDRLIPLLDHMQRYDSQRNLFEESTRAKLRVNVGRAMNAMHNSAPGVGAQVPLDLGDTAASLAQKEDYKTLRAVLSDLFGRAARNVATVMYPPEFKALTKHPDFQAGLRTYKDLVEKPMAESHELNEGIFSSALGPLDTYYPLVPVDKAEHGTQAQRVDRQRYARPKNLHNNFATGLADDYEASTEALRTSLTRAIHTNNKAALMDALEENGLVRKLGQFERGGDRVVVNGQEYDAVKVETSPGRNIIQNGKTTFLPPKQYLVPRWLHNELEPILTRSDKMAPSLARKIMNAANTVAISGPADFVFHSSNLFGTLVANTPFLGHSLLGKAGSAPILKKFVAIGKVLATDPTTEESARDLQEMAKLGILPDRYGSETYSKKFAELTGAQLHRLSAGPMLYGPKGVDVRARLVMYRLAKSINPDATGPELHLFVNQLGTYVDALQSQLVRGARKSGLAPFAEAGKSMLVNGVNAWTGAGPMPKSGPGLRIWQQLTGGGLGTVALWMLAHKAYTGKYPWEDKRSKLLQIPANPGHRSSKLGRALWGKGNDTGYINFGFFNPLAARGARALGIKGAADAAHLDGKWWQSLEAAQKDVANSFAHPFLGPIPRALFVGLTGDEPYLTGLRDDRARFEPQLLHEVHGTAGKSVLERPLAAAKELNSFYGNVGAATGIGEPREHDTTNRWVRMTFDLALPGLVGQAQNPYVQRRSLIRQAVSAQRTK